MLKKTLTTIALAAALPAFAQVGVDSQSTAGARAELGDVTTNTTLVLPGAPAVQGINYGGEYRVKGVPVQSAPSSFATPAVWRCAAAGTGGALQARDFGVSFGVGGGDSPICAREFRIAIAKSIISLRVAKDEGYDAALALACGDDDIADAFEGTADQCEAPKTATRKARLDRERADAARASRPVANSAPAAARPMPWQAGG